MPSQPLWLYQGDATRAALPIPINVCSMFVCLNNGTAASFLFLTCTRMLMHAIAHGGCMDTVRESALEADSGREIPCCTVDSNLHQYYAWFFSRTLYQSELSQSQSWSCSANSYAAKYFAASDWTSSGWSCAGLFLPGEEQKKGWLIM